jgi:hypothetical protein
MATARNGGLQNRFVFLPDLIRLWQRESLLAMARAFLACLSTGRYTNQLNTLRLGAAEVISIKIPRINVERDGLSG